MGSNVEGASLWLMPDGKWASVSRPWIDRLAERFRTARFPPHVTLLSGLSGEEADLAARARLAAAALAPVAVHLDTVEGRDEHFRCLFVRAVEAGPLAAAHAKAAEAFGRERRIASLPAAPEPRVRHAAPRRRSATSRTRQGPTSTCASRRAGCTSGRRAVPSVGGASSAPSRFGRARLSLTAGEHRSQRCRGGRRGRGRRGELGAADRHPRHRGVERRAHRVGRGAAARATSPSRPRAGRRGRRAGRPRPARRPASRSAATAFSEPAALLRLADERAHEVVRLAEGQALAGEGDREARRHHLLARGGGPHRLALRHEARDDAGHDGDRARSRCRRRRTRPPCPPAGPSGSRRAGPSAATSSRTQVAVHAGGLAAHELERVRVLLLRHEARAGGERLGQRDEAVLGRRRSG